jgi:very-short-patch-repair endonuclease
MVKKAPSAGAGARARTLRREMTEAERRLWQILRSRQTEGCRFRRQVPSSEAEVSRTRFLEGEGYRVLRFWNNEVLDNPEGVRAVIVENLQQVTPTPTLPHRGGGGQRGGGPQATTADPADPAQLIADLQRQPAECIAEHDEALQQESATHFAHPPPRWGRVGVGVMPRTDPW